MLKVILLCLVLITPTAVLYLNYTELDTNYGKLTENYDELTINFFDLEESFEENMEKKQKVIEELGNENQQLETDLDILKQDHIDAVSTLENLINILPMKN